MTTFSKSLEQLRSSKHWTKTQTAKCLGIPLTTYANYEYGDREPSLEMVCKIADLYEVSTDELFGRKNSKKGHGCFTPEQAQVIKALAYQVFQEQMKISDKKVKRVEATIDRALATLDTDGDDLY